jgi:hypothetical protein
VNTIVVDSPSQALVTASQLPPFTTAAAAAFAADRIESSN